jgi:hypothetical protein
MTFRLSDTEYEGLAVLAFVEKRAVTDVSRLAVGKHIVPNVSHDALGASLDGALRADAQPISELARCRGHALPGHQGDPCDQRSRVGWPICLA